MAKLKKKLKASTLIESLIAMLVIMLCFSIAVMIYLNVVRSDKLYQKNTANFILNEIAIQTKKEKKFIDESLKEGQFLIQKNVEKYQDTANLYRLHILAFNTRNEIIGEYNELIIAP
jgi:hypothetical protein